MKKKKKIIVIVIVVLILFPYVAYKIYERWPTEPTENWKMYDSLISVWPRLKREGIENIKLCWPYSPQTRLRPDVGVTEMFRIMDANVIKWWSHYSEVPEDCLPECINILDKAMKGMWWKRFLVPSATIRLNKMLIVTKKGKYIVNAGR